MRLTWFGLVSWRRPGCWLDLVLAVTLAFGLAVADLRPGGAGAPQKPTVAFPERRRAHHPLRQGGQDRRLRGDDDAPEGRPGEESSARGEAAGREPQAVQGPVASRHRGLRDDRRPGGEERRSTGSSHSCTKRSQPMRRAHYQKWTDTKATNPPSVFDLTLVSKMQVGGAAARPGAAPAERSAPGRAYATCARFASRLPIPRFSPLPAPARAWVDASERRASEPDVRPGVEPVIPVVARLAVPGSAGGSRGVGAAARRG